VLGLTPLARIVVTGVSGLPPELWAEPDRGVRGTQAGQGDHRRHPSEIGSYQELGIDIDTFTVNGEAIAVGHPFGVTGARITSTLINSLQWHDKQFGLETMCVGGGHGMALIATAWRKWHVDRMIPRTAIVTGAARGVGTAGDSVAATRRPTAPVSNTGLTEKTCCSRTYPPVSRISEEFDVGGMTFIF
jgi:hypothetical protein